MCRPARCLCANTSPNRVALPMRWVIGAVLVALSLAAFDPADAVGRSMTSCGVKAIYQGVALPAGSLVVTTSDQVEDAAVVYTPLRLSAGTYSVSVTRKG